MERPGRGRWIYPLFFAAVMALFLGILIYTWVQAERAGPVILDEKGQLRR